MTIKRKSCLLPLFLRTQKSDSTSTGIQRYSGQIFQVMPNGSSQLIAFTHLVVQRVMHVLIRFPIQVKLHSISLYLLYQQVHEDHS